MRPSRGTPTQNKVVVKRERERQRDIKQLNTWKRVISASLKAFTPLHLTATTVALPTLTQPNMWHFTGEQVSAFENFLLTSTSVCKNASLFELLKCDIQCFQFNQASGFRTLLRKVFCRRGRKRTFAVRFPSAALLPDKVSADTVSGSARNRRQ